MSKRIALIIPYVAILVGLHLAKSAYLAIFLYHIGIGLYLLWRRPANLGRQFLRGWNLPVGLPLALLSAGSGPLLILLWPVIAHEPDSLALTLAAWGLHGVHLWIFFGYFVIVNPVLEEAFWRSAHGSRNRFPALTDLAFAGYHALVLSSFLRNVWTLIATAILVFIAWIWRRTALQNGGLAIPTSAHILAGLSIMAAVIFLMQR